MVQRLSPSTTTTSSGSAVGAATVGGAGAVGGSTVTVVADGTVVGVVAGAVDVGEPSAGSRASEPSPWPSRTRLTPGGPLDGLVDRLLARVAPAAAGASTTVVTTDTAH